MAIEEKEQAIEERNLPTIEQVESEHRRNEFKKRYRKTLGSTISIFVVVAAIAVLITTLFIPVIQVSGNSMEPTLYNGDILVLMKSNAYERGEICCISWQNKKLLKRIIGLPGDKISMDIDGNVYVNDVLLEEPYLQSKCLGEYDITFPVIVPEGRLFVLGDERTISIDSRSSVIGCIGQDQIIGHVVMKVWPLGGRKSES